MGILKRGAQVISDAVDSFTKGSTAYFSLRKAGDSAVIRFLQDTDDLVSVYEHRVSVGGRFRNIPCLNVAGGTGNCPLCERGERPSLRTYLILLDKTNPAEPKTKIWKQGLMTMRTIMGLRKEYGALTNRDYKVERQGVELQTSYLFYPKDRSPEPQGIELPDLEGDVIKVYSREEILSLVADVRPVEQGASENDVPF